MDEIVSVVYGVDGKGVDHNPNVNKIEGLLQNLSIWYSNLPQPLQLQEGIVRSRGIMLLHMIYNQVSTTTHS
jgi:hypothetical protein